MAQPAVNPPGMSGHGVRSGRPSVVITMPGCGKTRVADSNPKYADADFGIWRQESGLEADWVAGLNRPAICRDFVRSVILPFLDEGRIVLTNEPALWPYIPTDVPVITVVPDINDEFASVWIANLIRRIIEETPEQLGDEQSFLSRVVLEGIRWPDSDAWRIPGAPQFRIRSYDELRHLLEAIA